MKDALFSLEEAPREPGTQVFAVDTEASERLTRIENTLQDIVGLAGQQDRRLSVLDDQPTSMEPAAIER